MAEDHLYICVCDAAERSLEFCLRNGLDNDPCQLTFDHGQTTAIPCSAAAAEKAEAEAAVAPPSPPEWKKTACQTSKMDTESSRNVDIDVPSKLVGISFNAQELGTGAIYQNTRSARRKHNLAQKNSGMQALAKRGRGVGGCVVLQLLPPFRLLVLIPSLKLGLTGPALLFLTPGL